MPGKGNDIVFLSKPDTVKQVLRNDVKYPVNIAVDSVGHLRRTDLKHRYPSGPGLLGQGQEWWEFRSAVQKDMLRPSSALHYITGVNNVTEKLIGRIDKEISVDRSQNKVRKIEGLTKEYAMEAICMSFLNNGLGILDGKPLGRRLLAANNNFFHGVLAGWFLPPKHAKWNPKYRSMLEAANTIIDITDGCIADFIENVKQDPGLQRTVLGKMISRSGIQEGEVCNIHTGYL